MRPRLRRILILPSTLLSSTLALGLLIGAAPTRALTDDACAGFKWDVSQERALFGSPALAQPAGKERTSATNIVPNHLYELQLEPQSQVTFSVPPGKKTADGSYAGLAALKVPASGSYRFSLDLPFWIDVVINSKLVPAKDYEGQRGCNAPHKIVVFDVDANRKILLQISGASQPVVRLTVTRVSGG
jgi:hypothetical protein